MGKPVANQRLFVALYPPRDVASRCLNMLGEMELPRRRVVPVEQIHLTLQFIGDTSVKQLDNVMESVMRSAGGIKSFDLTIEKLAPIPMRGSARLIAAHTDAPPQVLEIQRRLATRLSRNSRERPGDRFLPHISLCRFRIPLRDCPAGIALDSNLAWTFTVDHVCLMRSILHHEGAEHIELARVVLV